MLRLPVRTTALALLLVVLAGTGTVAAAKASSLTPPPAAFRTLTSSITPKGLGIRLLDYPPQQASDPRDHEYIIQTATPGTTITRHVEITNTTGRAEEVQIYASAASISHGSFDIAQTSQNALSSWIHPSSGLLDLAEGEHVDDTVSITVPENAAGGEHYAVVWAEMTSPASTGAGSVTVVNRVGIRAYINVGNASADKTAFAIRSVTAGTTPTHKTLRARVANTGDLSVEITGSARLTGGPGGTSAGPYKSTQTTSLGPGQQAMITFSLPAALAAGPWTADLGLASGDVTRTAHTRVTFPDSVAATPHTGNSRRPLVEGGGAVVILIILALLLMRRRRKRSHNS